jgi:hypothetical protein
VNTNAIESQQIHSGVASTARLKRIQKDRQRRPAEQMRRNGGNSSDSDSHRSPEPEPNFSLEEMQEDIHLRNEIEETFEKRYCPRKNQMADARLQGKRINIVI